MVARVSTRFLGHCQYCGGEFKLAGSRPGAYAVVLHGYKRPGDGNIHGHCLGTDHAPWETTCEDTRRWLAAEEREKAAFEEKLAEVKSPHFRSELYLEPNRRKGETEGRWVRPDDHAWAELRRGQESRFEHAVWALKQIMRTHMDLVSTWRGPQPVVSFEEKTREIEVHRAANKQVRVAAKEDKLAKKVAHYQKAVDSLVRHAAASMKKFERDKKAGRHMPEYTGSAPWLLPPPYEEADKLIDLAYGFWSRTFYDFGFGEEGAFDLIDRLPVWQALGLYDAQGRPITALIAYRRGGPQRRVLVGDDGHYGRRISAEQVEGLRRLVGMPSTVAGQSRGRSRRR